MGFSFVVGVPLPGPDSHQVQLSDRCRSNCRSAR